jgi:hypothetical protein
MHSPKLRPQQQRQEMAIDRRPVALFNNETNLAYFRADPGVDGGHDAVSPRQRRFGPTSGYCAAPGAESVLNGDVDIVATPPWSARLRMALELFGSSCRSSHLVFRSRHYF